MPRQGSEEWNRQRNIQRDNMVQAQPTNSNDPVVVVEAQLLPNTDDIIKPLHDKIKELEKTIRKIEQEKCKKDEMIEKYTNRINIMKQKHKEKHEQNEKRFQILCDKESLRLDKNYKTLYTNPDKREMMEKIFSMRNHIYINLLKFNTLMYYLNVKSIRDRNLDEETRLNLFMRLFSKSIQKIYLLIKKKEPGQPVMLIFNHNLDDDKLKEHKYIIDLDKYKETDEIPIIREASPYEMMYNMVDY